MTNQQIFDQLGIKNSDDSLKSQLLMKIMAIADMRFARVVDEVMTDEERVEFEAFSKDKGPEEVAAWVNSKYQGIGKLYDAIIQDIVADLKSKNIPGKS